MHTRQLMFLLLLFAAGFSAGCRNGVAVGGHSLSWLLPPVYQHPAGYSSTYEEHRFFTPVSFETVGDRTECETCRKPEPDDEDSVIIPEECGPECRRRINATQRR